MKKENENLTNILFKLNDTMTKKGYTRSRLSRESGLRFETVQSYYNGNVRRVDLYTLSQLCKILDCNIQDIIEYTPDK